MWKTQCVLTHISKIYVATALISEYLNRIITKLISDRSIDSIDSAGIHSYLAHINSGITEYDSSNSWLDLLIATSSIFHILDMRTDTLDLLLLSCCSTDPYF